MKVAIISENRKRSGKTVVSTLLGVTFALTQRKRSAMFATEKYNDVIRQCSVDISQSQLKSMNVYNALIKNAALGSHELLDYADRLGKTDCFAFDIFSSNVEKEKLYDTLITTINRCPTELTLVEIKGDIHDEYNLQVLNNCDVILYVFNTDPMSYAALKEYKDNFKQEFVVRTGYICQKHEEDTFSEKQICKALGIPNRNLMVIPYNKTVMKACMAGNLETLGNAISRGEASVSKIRIKMLEIMQYLYDSRDVKYIKGFSKWPQ